MKKIFCCPDLELFHCLPHWTTVRLYGKKLQNATKHFRQYTVEVAVKVDKYQKLILISSIHVNKRVDNLFLKLGLNLKYVLR